MCRLLVKICNFICENLHRVFVENMSRVFGEILQRAFGELEI